MAASRWRIVSRSFFKLLVASDQNHRSLSANRCSKLYLGYICKGFCSNISSKRDQERSSLTNDQRDVPQEASSCRTGKQLNLVVSSLRVDRVAATGFGIGRRKLHLLLLAGKLYLNKNKVEKMSAQVSWDDILELVSKDHSDSQDDNSKVYMSRLEITEIGQLTRKGNLRISLTRHRSISLDRGIFNKIYKKKKYS